MIDKQGVVLGEREFRSVTEAARELGMTRQTLNAMLTGQNPNRLGVRYLGH